MACTLADALTLSVAAAALGGTAATAVFEVIRRRLVRVERRPGLDLERRRGPR